MQGVESSDKNSSKCFARLMLELLANEIPLQILIPIIVLFFSVFAPLNGFCADVLYLSPSPLGDEAV